MKLFQCQSCRNIVYFENSACGRCGCSLAYMPECATITALAPLADGLWTPLAAPQRPSRFCANAGYAACNWLVPAGSADGFCLACRHNDIVPNLSDPAQLHAWREIEFAKHRLIYSLLRFKLPLKTRSEDPKHGLQFDFLADPPEPSGVKVMTGHDNGLITVALTEADDAERELRRKSMGEPYRTLIGHFRHEIGHHYWDLLVRDRRKLDACRTVFGDDQDDYVGALQRHYAGGVPAAWQQRFVSAYATTHPWEDFAETWAHYLHIVDTLDTIQAFGMEVRPEADQTGAYAARIDFDPYEKGPIERLINPWFPFVLALNNVGRAIGRGDFYPFVLSPAVIAKLGFVHDLIHGNV